MSAIGRIRARVAAIGVVFTRHLARSAALLGHWRAELLASLALVGGWGLVTWGLTGIPFLRPRIVWPISSGLLLLTLFGWGYLAKLGVIGVYTLTREGR